MVWKDLRRRTLMLVFARTLLMIFWAISLSMWYEAHGLKYPMPCTTTSLRLANVERPSSMSTQARDSSVRNSRRLREGQSGAERRKWRACLYWSLSKYCLFQTWFLPVRLSCFNLLRLRLANGCSVAMLGREWRLQEEKRLSTCFVLWNIECWTPCQALFEWLIGKFVFNFQLVSGWKNMPRLCLMATCFGKTSVWNSYHTKL